MSCCLWVGFLSSSWQSYSKHSSSPPLSLRDIAEVTPKPKHHPKGPSLGVPPTPYPEEPCRPGPPGHTLHPGPGRRHALAQLKWRGVHKAPGPASPGQDPEGGGSYEPGGGEGRGGVKHLVEWECPARRRRFRGKPCRQVQDLCKLSASRLSPPFLPQQQ